MTLEWNVLFADDNGHSERVEVESGIVRAVRGLSPRLTLKWDVVTRRATALERLEDLRAHIDIALIDVIWNPGIGKQERDLAADLLRKALARPETVVILISSSPADLLRYAYNASSVDIRPHAVLAKSLLDENDIVAGVLEAAFAAKWRALRSYDIDFDWSEPAALHRHKLVAEEMVCQSTEHAEGGMITPIGGGLSDSLTVLVEAKVADSPHGASGVQRAMLKFSEDPSVIQTEIDAHLRYVPRWPTGTFARPIRGEVYRFGSWTGLSFEQVDGRTVSSMRQRFVLDNGLNRAYDRPIQASYIERADAQMRAPAEVLGGDAGQLSPERWNRFRSSLRELSVSREVVDSADVEISAVLPATKSVIPTAVVHGDLHTRNVLVRPDGVCYWVDAASIRSNGIWCEDIARLVAWLVSELATDLVRGVSATRIERVITHGCGLSTQRGATPWSAKIRDFVDLFRETALELWSTREQPASVPVRDNWLLAVGSELLRVSYSAGTFSPRVRAAAASVGVRTLIGLRQPTEDAI